METARMAPKIEALKTYFVFFAREDYTDLSRYVLDVKEELSLSDPNEVRQVTMGIVSDLLKEGLVRVGFPTRDGGFDAWSASPEEAIPRIRHEWDALGREPNPWEIVWFEATQKGEKYVAGYSPRNSGLTVENAG